MYNVNLHCIKSFVDLINKIGTYRVLLLIQ